jgi:hypothetical protein
MIEIALFALLVVVACVLYLGAAIGWIPGWLITAPVGWAFGVAVRAATVVARWPVRVLVLFASIACGAHSLVMMGLPLPVLHLLRGENAIKRWLLTTRYRRTIDRLNKRKLNMRWIRWVCAVVEFFAKLALMALRIVMQMAFDPAVSRMALTTLLLPLLAAIVMWGAMPTLVMPALVLVVPDGWIEKDGTGADKEQIVYVSAALLVGVGGTFVLLNHFAPALAAWAAGKPPPAHYLAGLAAAVFASLLFAGIYADGNTKQAMLKDTETDLDKLIAPDVSAPDTSAVHLSALAVALAVACVVHLTLPIINRKHFARLWLLGAADKPNLFSPGA